MRPISSEMKTKVDMRLHDFIKSKISQPEQAVESVSNDTDSTDTDTG